jgi:hypothetical protein
LLRRVPELAAPGGLPSTPPSAGRFPMQHIYKCPQGKSAVADTVGR